MFLAKGAFQGRRKLPPGFFVHDGDTFLAEQMVVIADDEGWLFGTVEFEADSTCE